MIQSVTAGQIRDRVYFCQAILHWDLPPIVFSDEPGSASGQTIGGAISGAASGGDSIVSQEPKGVGTQAQLCVEADEMRDGDCSR